MSASALRNDRAPRMIDDEALAHQPAHGHAVLEQRVHPRIGMRIVRRGRSVHRVAAGVRGHRHHAHAVGQASVHRLQVLVVEGLGQQHRGDGFHKLRIGDRRRALPRTPRCAPWCPSSSSPPRPITRCAMAWRSSSYSRIRFAASALPAAPRRSFQARPALATKRSLLAWKTGRM